MKQKPVYQTDSNDLFIYETVANELALSPGHFNIPFGAYEDEPPPAPPGKVQRRVGGGSWAIVDDYRATQLWVVETGVPYALGAELDGPDGKVSYPGWGPLPAWLTQVEPPRPIENTPADA